MVYMIILTNMQLTEQCTIAKNVLLLINTQLTEECPLFIMYSIIFINF